MTHTDSSGRWMIPEEKTWHAAVIAAPPTGISLLPRFEGTHLPYEITIEADGYDKWKWVAWVDEDTIDSECPLNKITHIFHCIFTYK